jgi:hypothetical protein
VPFNSKGEWRPDGVKQEQFLALPETIKEAIIGGGVQTGKTELLLMYGVARRWHLNPQFKQVYMRRQLNQLRTEVVPRAKNIFGRMEGWKYNGSYYYWVYEPTGAMIFLAGCEYEDDVHNWDSTEITLFTPDELTSFTEWMYLYIGFERTRSPKGSGLPALIRGAAMPGDIGHTWVRKRFVDPAPEGNKIILGRGNQKRVYIHATLADSERVDKEYEAQLDALPEAERQAKKFGNWNSYQGQVFTEFRERHYPGEPENALHVVSCFDIPLWWPKIFIIDWGFAAFNYVGYGAISPNRRVYFYRERFWQRKTISEWGPYVKEDIKREQPRIIRICKSAKQQRGQEHTIQEDVQTELDFPVELTNNSPGTRVAGKQLIHEYLRWKPKYTPDQVMPTYSEEYALYLLRNEGLDKYKSYLNSLVPQEPETNIPKLQIFDKDPLTNEPITLLNEALKACVYAKSVSDNKAQEDVAEFVGDDPYDVLRYMLDAVDAFFEEASDEMTKLEKQQAIQNKFEETQDWNFLYRNAKLIEEANEELVRPIRRLR